VWPSRPATDHFQLPSMPCNTPYCFPRYSITRTLTER
jgi:hypothetical protein